ncbi:hypothetical protein H0I76_15860 [Limibaculum sp. M0105]|uniref:Lipoprotein n=1 Tax=Thermohalobaculum xanthum TaxID=2753746 RepID=A0A8J7MAT6_9RHOB|nr:hypothetical protein [Thermohalobaculum xanthum]MBK0400674.1 hypothetical protein [Thermohalobaculum xanthum]
MTRYLKIGAAVLAAAMLAGCTTSDLTPEEDRIVQSADVVSRGTPPLTAAEISIYLTDSTLSHVGEKRLWHVYIGPDGGLYGLAKSQDGATERNRGQWSVRDNGTGGGLLCRQWERDWGSGMMGCATVYRFGNEYVFIPEGVVEKPEDGIRRTRSPGDSQRVI